MKGLNLPSHVIPLQFLNGFDTRTHRQVGDQFPVDFLPLVRCSALLRMNDGEQKFRVLLVFADRWKHSDAAVFDFQNGFGPITLFITDLEAMRSLDPDFFHFHGNRMFPVSRQAIHTGAHQEMGAQRLSGAEKLVNITLPVADMNAALRVIQKGGGLAHVLQPAGALLFINRHAGRIDFLFKRVATLEFAASPELHGRQAKRKSSGGDGSLIAPRERVGTLGGIVNLCNHLAGIAAPIATGYVVRATNSF